MGLLTSGTGADGADLRFYQWLGLIALFALIVRLAIRLVVGTDNYWTHGYSQYADLAQSLCAGHGYAFPGEPPTAFRVPFYAFLVAVTTCGAGSPWPLIAAQALASSTTALLAGLIARRMAGSAAGLAAAAIYAVWSYAAWHDVSLQESGFFAFLSALATWLLISLRDRQRSGAVATGLLAGLVLGLGVLTRSTLLPFALCGLVWIAFTGKRWRNALLAALAFSAVLAPWLERAHRITGDYGLGTESGAFLYAANHPLTFSAFPTGSFDETRANVFAAMSQTESAEVARLDVSGQDRWFRARAITAITADPLTLVPRAMRKLWAAFGPWPVPRHSLSADLAYAVCWVPFVLLALTGLWLRRREWRVDLLLHLQFLTFRAATALFWAQTAHRSAIDPFLAVFAGVALAKLRAKRTRI